MDHPTWVEADLMDAATVEGDRQSRSAKQQLDHWAHVGGAVSAQPSTARRRVEAALAGELGESHLNAEERAVFNAELDTSVSEAARSIHFGEILAARGVTTVALDEHGHQHEDRLHPTGHVRTRRRGTAVSRAPWVAHFGLKRTPFGKSIPARDLYNRPAHQEAIARINFCVVENALGDLQIALRIQASSKEVLVMSTRSNVRAYQRRLGELDAEHTRAQERLASVRHRRDEVLAAQDRQVREAERELDKAVVAMAEEIGPELTANLLDIEVTEVKQLVRRAKKPSVESPVPASPPNPPREAEVG